MTGWTTAQLEAIGAAAEIEIAPDRADSSPGPATTIWVVRVGDDLLVRSYRGPNGRWYRRTRRTGRGRIRTATSDYRVEFLAADPSIRPQVDAAYRTKYGRHPSYVAPLLADSVAGTTLQLRKLD